ncbi:tetratricopeptide repeat protein [Streptomyces griseosporeus]|uniref:tetratricopeptide repeat protein n=1 Tax=Streptomyces griseosporeus TaxID=1910 RepID=UPI00167E6BDC|nr:hypothetical protein [Streptomyces griseosporeus]GHF55242.1 hypothetical protein GCM10018783_25390 [Streptomyces griseosporeus]
MFSRKNRRPKSPELLKAWESLDAGDLPGALRVLRAAAEEAPLAEVVQVTARAAAAAGFDDLRQAAEALAARPERAQEQYDFGYACVERGVPVLAIPALGEALRQAPQSAAVLRELVTAYEREDRHREAVTVLSAREETLADWPDRYLLAYNALMSGDLDLARRQHDLLSDPAADPDDRVWLPARDRQRAMLQRAASAAQASPLDGTDLRGWQYVMGGTLLGTLSPFGFDAGMNGRYAWLQDSYDLCLRGLLRLKAVLEATGVRPDAVALLSDRDSHVLGLAAAEVLGLPARPFEGAEPGTVVVAHDLNELAGTERGPEILAALRERAPGQVLHEHASCWTDPPAVAADSVGLLHQHLTAPWAERMRLDENGEVGRSPADDRPAAEIAAEITGADPTPDEGDGSAPADPPARLTDLATAVADTWLRGPRDGLRSAGPVPSSRFA